MNTSEIRKALSLARAGSIGVYAADRVPFNLTLPAALVVNTDPASKPGQHWIAIYIDKNGSGVYFDSYGEQPTSRHHRHRLRQLCKRVEYNRKRLQSLDSTVCGEYCIMFIYNMCSGRTLRSFCNVFSRDTRSNDRIVSQFCSKLLKKIKRKNEKNVSVNYFPNDVSRGTGNQICTSRSVHNL